VESRKRIKQPIAGRWAGNSQDTTVLNFGESSGTSVEAPIMGAEQQPRVGFETVSKNKKSVGSSKTKKGEIPHKENADYGKRENTKEAETPQR
jgi:hypothetical protein